MPYADFLIIVFVVYCDDGKNDFETRVGGAAVIVFLLELYMYSQSLFVSVCIILGCSFAGPREAVAGMSFVVLYHSYMYSIYLFVPAIIIVLSCVHYFGPSIPKKW